MKLVQTRRLLQNEFDREDLPGCLTLVLRSVIELLSMPGNDFAWSHWENVRAAVVDIEMLIEEIEKGHIPENDKVGILFAPTSDIQEVSISSGWGDVFLKVAEKYDEIETLVWPLG